VLPPVKAAEAAKLAPKTPAPAKAAETKPASPKTAAKPKDSIPGLRMSANAY
jgi:hypothetical protein